MNFFSLSIALRYLFAKKKSLISVLSIFAISGVAIGVAALIIVMAVMNGFTNTLRDKILSVSAHGIITPLQIRSLPEDTKLLQDVLSLSQISGITPFVYSEVILSTPQGVKGLLVRGIDPLKAENTIQILSSLVEGTLMSLVEIPDPTAPRGIILGEELVKALRLSIGDTVSLLSSSGKKTAAGYLPKSLRFELVGIFKTGMFEYDMTLSFVNITSLRNLLGIAPTNVSGYEFSLYNLNDAQKVRQELTNKFTPPYSVRTWQDMNVNLFAALELEKTAMFIFLTLIIFVGAFSIVTTLIMLVLEKVKDIAILMSMGATQKQIRAIFVLQGTFIGIVGTSIGFILGITISLLLRKYQFISLPQGVYPFSTIPVIFIYKDIVLTIICSLLLCFLATIYPAHRASRINPSTALRYE
ncbi:MAG: FtsX-like permease family protein [Desulfovibrionaceae bacterium]